LAAVQAYDVLRLMEIFSRSLIRGFVWVERVA
jgi:hypothetical protein